MASNSVRTSFNGDASTLAMSPAANSGKSQFKGDSPAASAASIKRGHLVKLGHVVKSWKKRYFVLDPENLSYFKHDKLKGLIPVSKITNLLCQMDNRGRSIGFEIQTSVGKNYTLMCDNEAERTDWLKAIREAQSFASKAKSAGSKVVNRGEFAILVQELSGMPAKVSSQELIDILQKFRDLFGMASSRSKSLFNGENPVIQINEALEAANLRTSNAWTAKVEKNFNDVLKIAYTLYQDTFIIPIVDGQFEQMFDFFEELGQGSFATVYRCRNISAGVDRAVKKITKAKLTEEDDMALRNEVTIMSQLRHPNIVQLIMAYETPTHYFLVMELVTGGELFERLLEKKSYSEMEARNLTSILLSAIAYCHRKHVVHRDLKPENILLANIHDDAAIKIADFGFAQKIQAGGLNTDCGSPWYVAPEILRAHPYDASVDMWSLGVIVYILLCGYPPFHDDNQLLLFQKIKKGAFKFDSPHWDNISGDAKHLISNLLVLDPRRRLSVEQALKHAWIAGDKVPMGKLEVALGKLRQFNQRRHRSIKTGIFSKKGAIVKNWKQRCFVLTADSLSYYQSEHSQNAKGHIFLKDIISVDAAKGKASTSLSIRTTAREYQLQFSNPHEQQEWRHTIEAVIRGTGCCRKSLEALKKQDLAAAFDFADKARRIKEMRKTDVLMEAWCALGNYSNRAMCQGIWMQRSFDEVHSSIVTCLAWSDNGNLIATGSTDCSLIMWDAATGNKLRTCVGHTGSVQAVCFLTNARIVSGSSDKSVMLWDADNGKKLQRYMKHKDNVSTVAASKDGQTIASGSWDNKVIVWDIRTGAPLRMCHGHTKSITCLSVSANGLIGISGGADKRVIVWNLALAKPLFSFVNHSDVVTSVAMSFSGKIALSAAADGTMAMWDIDTGTLNTMFSETPTASDKKAHAMSVKTVLLSSDATFAVSVGEDRAIKVWDLRRNGLLKRVDVHPEAPNCAALSGQGGVFLLGTRNGVQQWVIDWVLEYKGSLYGTGTDVSNRVDLSKQKSPTSRMATVLADGNLIARAKAAAGVITEAELKRIEEINRMAAESGVFTAS